MFISPERDKIGTRNMDCSGAGTRWQHCFCNFLVSCLPWGE